MKKFKIILVLTVFILLGLVITNYMVSSQAEDFIYDSVEDIPKNKVGLLLGAVKITSNGNVNSYYTHRLNGAVEFIMQEK